MPELPEVETIRRQIAPLVQGQTVTYARVHRARAVRAHASPAEFIAAVSERTILAAHRRGKALVLPLSGDRSLLIRLGMSGMILVEDPQTPLRPHTHVVLGLSNEQELRYSDPRTFGQMAVVDGHDPDRMIELGHYGCEPLGDDFTPDVLARAMSGKKSLVQSVLMDQTKVVGIGKIYADESCFLAGIDPRRAGDSLQAEEIVRLHGAIREVLTLAIAHRGTSGHDGAYRDASGSHGEFQHRLHVYQRANEPCRVCGTLIEYRPIQGRRMHFCPRCQK